MVSSSEKNRLLEAYREPVDAHVAVAKAVAGLVVIISIAVIGAAQPVEDERTAQVSSEQAASGR
jgi:hypothetical protein